MKLHIVLSQKEAVAISEALEEGTPEVFMAAEYAQKIGDAEAAQALFEKAEIAELHKKELNALAKVAEEEKEALEGMYFI